MKTLELALDRSLSSRHPRTLPSPRAALATGALLLACLAAVAAIPRFSRPSPASPRPAALAQFRKLPLSFETNRGQADPRVPFLARGAGSTVFLSASEAVISPRAPGDAASVRLHLAGSRANAPVVGEGKQPGVSHYLHGRDPRRWIRNVARFDRVRVRGAYPGVDVVYYGAQRPEGTRLEYDFLVAPGSDPGSIRLAVEPAGAGPTPAARVASNGDLVLRTPAGKLVQQRPVAYQEIAGRRVAVRCAYRLDQGSGAHDPHAGTPAPGVQGSGELPQSAIRGAGVPACGSRAPQSAMVQFELGRYDRKRPLVIDPVVFYSTFLGGDDEDRANAVAVDSAGAAYVFGTTLSTDFPVKSPKEKDSLGGEDLFVTKIAADGSLVYSTYLGGMDDDEAGDIAVDASGSTYLTGLTYSDDYPTASPLRPLAGVPDAFVTKLNAAGSAFVYSTYLGGNDEDFGNGIAVDGAGNAYVAGGTASTNFPTTAGAPQRTRRGTADAFVAKINANGAALGYSTYLGGDDEDTAKGLAVDGTGAVCVVGVSMPSGGAAVGNFPTAGGMQTTYGGGNSDGFVTRLQPGGGIAWSSYLGGSGSDSATRAALDASGSVFLAGQSSSPNLPALGSYQPVNRGGIDAFVAAVPGGGGGFNWLTYLGGSSDDTLTGIGVDAAGQVGISGTTFSPDFPTTAALQPSLRGAMDAYFARLDRTGTRLLVGTYLGGAGDDLGSDLAVEPNGGAVLVGSTRSTDFPTFHALQPSLRPAPDAFVTRLSPDAPAAPTDLTATATSTSQIVLTWKDKSFNETGFEVERATGVGGSFQRITTTAPNVTGFTDNGLADATLYVYRVRAINSGGPSGYSNEAATSTLPFPPGAPTLLTATAVSHTRIDLSWKDNATNETGFKLERRGTTGDWTQVATPAANATSYTDEGLQPSTRYFYRIRATNAGGDSALSNEADATTLIPPPNAPTNLAAAPQSDTSIRLTWNDNSSDETLFKIERKPGPGDSGSVFAQVASVPAGATTYVDPGLSPLTTYSYRVRAAHTRDSDYSNVATATTLPSPPLAPTTLVATAVSQTRIDLTWQDRGTNETEYLVERKTGSGDFTQLQSLPVNTTAFSDTGLSPNTLYTYRVRAGNAGGKSGYSNDASATTLPTLPAAPANLTATAISYTQIDLAWTDLSDNESGFKIERKPGLPTDPGSYAPAGEVAAGVHTFSDTQVSAETTYTYRVRATNRAGDSAPSNEASATTPANVSAAPSRLTATAVSQTDIDLTWQDNGANETGFKIERKLGPPAGMGSFEAVTTVGQNVTQFRDTGRAPNTTYTYRVAATNSGGDSDWSNLASATTLPAAPLAPAGLAVATLSTTSLRLTWNDVSDELQYQVERRLASAPVGDYRLVATLDANRTTWDDPDLSPDTAYTYRLRAGNAGGFSPYSDEATGTTLPLPPAAPTDLAAILIDRTTARLTWTDASNNETKFLVERSTDGGLTFQPVGETAAGVATFDNGDLAAGTRFVYRVKAVNRGGESAYSNLAEVTTLPGAPNRPANLTAVLTGRTTAHLTWSDQSENETKFVVERSSDGGQSFQVIGEPSAGSTTFDDPGLEAGTRYVYRVKAVNTGGESAYSNLAEVTTLPNPPAAPTGLKAEAASQTEVRLTWDAAEAGATIRVERKSGSGDFADLGIQLPAGTTTYSDKTVQAATAYVYRIRASNAGGDSPYSNEASVTTPANPPRGVLVVASKVDFGRVPMGKTAKKGLKIANGSRSESLQVTLTPPKKPFQLLGATRSFTLEPGKSVTVELTFKPVGRGKRSTGTLAIASSDPRKRTAKVTLTGVGK